MHGKICDTYRFRGKEALRLSLMRLRHSLVPVMLLLCAAQSANATAADGWRIVKRVGMNADTTLRHVTSSSRTNAWAFGEVGTDLSEHLLAYHWDGKTWSYSPLPRKLGNLVAGAVTTSPKNTWLLTLKSPE